MKKVLAVAAAGAVAVLALASSAAAAVQDEPVTTLPPANACVFSVNPATSQTFPVVVTVSGTAPVGSSVTVFVAGATKGGPTVVGAGGTFSFANISVASANTPVQVGFTFGNKNAYTAVCVDALGSTEIRVKAEAATALAFTGSSSNTPTYVLVGIAAIVIGLVMVVGVRRRASVRG
jgi:LPXTG-motif cell wall-anchored protein